MASETFRWSLNDEVREVRPWAKPVVYAFAMPAFAVVFLAVLVVFAAVLVVFVAVVMALPAMALGAAFSRRVTEASTQED